MRSTTQLASLGSILAFLFASTLLCRADGTLTGRWEGSVQIPGNELRVIVDLDQENKGGWAGSIIAPDLGLKGLPLTNLQADGAGTSFTVGNSSGLQAIVAAHFDSDNTMTGTFTQGGNTAPIVLQRTGLAQVELPPHSTAVAKEFEGEWKGAYELFGYSRKVTLRLTNHEQNGATAEFIVVGKKVNNLPVDLITQEADLLTITVPSMSINYEGRLRTGELKGTFTQGGIEVPLIFQRSQ